MKAGAGLIIAVVVIAPAVGHGVSIDVAQDLIRKRSIGSSEAMTHDIDLLKALQGAKERLLACYNRCRGLDVSREIAIARGVSL